MPPKRTRLNDYPPQQLSRKTNLIDIDMEFAILETRVNSYAPPTKRSKAGWPHKSPTVADLAKAGFFYQPAAGKDNVECFMCARQLDGWEADDDPLQEHLKHGSDCAWALLMSIEQEGEYDDTTMEDPTGEHIADARRNTFESIGWPHESKKGWVCKIDKMVEAGWYFAPTTECEDYTSCVYCKLSLDGWEPKDDPFEEHYRRSPNCPFFTFAGTTAPSKRPKQKKGRASRTSRTSKVSRLSTQSTATLASQAESIDLDQSTENVIDNSIVSISSTTSATTKAKRKAPARAKIGKAKKARTTRSKKEDTTLESQAMSVVGIEEASTSEILHPSTEKITVEKAYRSRNTKSQHTQHSPAVPREASYPVLPQTTPEKKLQKTDGEAEPYNHSTTPQNTDIGPPARERTPVPIKQISPLKEQTNPPRPTISPVQADQNTTKRRSSRRSRVDASQSSSSQERDTENIPPQVVTKAVRLPSSSPGAPPPDWTPVDVNTVFKTEEDIELFRGAIDGELSDKEKDMTVQEWIQHIAVHAEARLSREGERMVGIFEREGRRALGALESIQCI